MKKIVYIIVALMLFVSNMAFAQAPGGGQGPMGGGGPGMGGPGGPGGKGGPMDGKGMPPMGKKQKPEKQDKQIVNLKALYIYGMALNPTDSVIYMTDELILDSAQIYKKTKFLVNRDEYSTQLKTYMDNKGEANRTCAVTYATTVKALDKKYKKEIAYLKKKGYLVKYADQSEFRFTTVRQ